MVAERKIKGTDASKCLKLQVKTMLPDECLPMFVGMCAHTFVHRIWPCSKYNEINQLKLKHL